MSERLERALSIWLEQQALGSDPGELLERHADLRELLEPLLGEPDESKAPPEPARLGDFELRRRIARGGMGVVWEARQCSLDRTVALKLLAPELTASPAAIVRLRREATTAARLNHRNLVKVLGLGQEGDVHFLAMELVDGEPIGARPRSIEANVALVAQVADALACVHGAGIVHRDVKPANILVTGDGNAVLTDFGLARDASRPSWSTAGSFAGTPEYASPEQLRGAPVDAVSDVFSLGVTLFELLTGQRPYPGAGPAAVLEAIAAVDAAPDPSRLARGIPRGLAAVLRCAIAPRREDRYPSATAFAADLRAWLQGGALAVRPTGPWRAAWRWARREPWRAALVAVLAIALPLLAGLVGHGIAMRPLVRAGEALAREERIEAGLADAYLALSVGDAPRAQLALDAVLEFEPTQLEARRIRAVVAAAQASAAAADAAADPTPDPAAGADELELVVATLEGAVGDLLRASQRGLRASAEELGNATAARAALPAVSRATRLATRPRLPLYVMLASLSAIANVPASARDAELVLATRWPEALAARRARARAMRCFDQPAAIALYRELVAERPKDVQLHFELVGTLCASGDKAAAATASEAVVALAPMDPMAHVCVAEHRLESGRPAEAVAPYRQALALGLDEGRTHYNLGVALLESGQDDAAVAAFRAALERTPNDARAWTNLAGIALDRGELESALTSCQRAVAADPRLAPAHENLLVAARELGRSELLVAECERWAKAHPFDRAAWHAAVDVLLEFPELPDAKPRALQHALRAHALGEGEDAESVRRVAAAWESLGLPEAARQFPLRASDPKTAR